MEIDKNIINISKKLLDKLELDEKTKKILSKFIVKHISTIKIQELVTRVNNIIKANLINPGTNIKGLDIKVIGEILADLKQEIKNYLSGIATNISDSEKKVLAKFSVEIILLIIIIVLDKIDSKFDIDTLFSLIENFDVDISDMQTILIVTSTCFSFLKCFGKN